MSALSNIAFVTKLLPIIAGVVREIEELDSTPGKGPQKLQAALVIVKAIYESTGPEKPFSDIVKAVELIVAAVVKFYNDIGAFVKRSNT